MCFVYFIREAHYHVYLDSSCFKRSYVRGTEFAIFAIKLLVSLPRNKTT